MDYQRITITRLSNLSMHNNTMLLYDIAVLFAKTGFYAKSIKIRNKALDPFKRIIDAFIIPNADKINVHFYNNQLIGFYLADIIRDSAPRDLNTIIPMNEINWSNHGSVIYNFYEVYFQNNEFLIDNIALNEYYQRNGVFTNIIFPNLLDDAKKLSATSIVIAVFKHQNNNALRLYLKLGFKQIANLKFKLEQVFITPNEIIDETTEELVLLRLNI